MRATAATSTFVGLMVAVLVGSAACAQDIAYDINQIQRALVIHGYNIGSVDGLLGRRSINSLAAHSRFTAGGDGRADLASAAERVDVSSAWACGPVERNLSAQGHIYVDIVPVARGDTRRAPAAGAVASAIAVIFLFVLRRRTTQIVQNASASFTGHVSISTNIRLSPPLTSKSSGAHPEVNQPINPVTSNVQISPDLTASIAAHNAKVEKAITAKLAEDAGLSAVAATVNSENSNNVLSPFAKGGTQFIALKESLAAHNATVRQAIREIRIRHVADIGDHSAVGRRGKRMELVSVEIDADHPSAQRDRQFRDGLADPLRRAGDDDGFSFQRHHILHDTLPLSRTRMTSSHFATTGRVLSVDNVVTDDNRDRH